MSMFFGGGEPLTHRVFPAALPGVPEPARRAALEGGVRRAPQQLQAAGWDAIPVAQGLLL